METSTPSQITAETLMATARGRRLVLEYAITTATTTRDEAGERLVEAVTRASLAPAPDGPGFTPLFGDVDAVEAPEVESGTPENVAERLQALALGSVTDEALRVTLGCTVDAARYWQEPDALDQLASTAPVAAALHRFAAHLADTPAVRSWLLPVRRTAQWAIGWEGNPPIGPLAPDSDVLATTRAMILESERRAQHDRPADPTAKFSGDWWSTPGFAVPSSTPPLADGTPSGLYFVEDTLGWTSARTVRLGAASDLRVFEVGAPEHWAELCRHYPLVVTASKRHDWYRTTGRDGDWVMPDWARVAEDYDAVHLQVAGYLWSGTAIPVDEHSQSVIAGWNPDETYWFTDRIRLLDQPRFWQLDTTDDTVRWLETTPRP